MPPKHGNKTWHLTTQRLSLGRSLLIPYPVFGDALRRAGRRGLRGTKNLRLLAVPRVHQ